ncbi:MAG TPA: hypothetical protein VFV50_06855, partial [Bdellovibrionales bacterium]|nr:hypothetical protein [Bdellovibrionales bacterium]
MKKALASIALVLSFAPALNATQRQVLVRSQAASEIELEQFLLVHPSYQSFADHLRTKRLHAPERKALLDAYEGAQRAFIESSLDRAKAAYQKVAAKRLELSWPDSDRKLIYLAMLRLGQIDKRQEAEWLRAAAR